MPGFPQLPLPIYWLQFSQGTVVTFPTFGSFLFWKRFPKMEHEVSIFLLISKNGKRHTPCLAHKTSQLLSVDHSKLVKVKLSTSKFIEIYKVTISTPYKGRISIKKILSALMHQRQHRRLAVTPGVASLSIFDTSLK